jgi:hypothetical protein
VHGRTDFWRIVVTLSTLEVVATSTIEMESIPFVYSSSVLPTQTHEFLGTPVARARADRLVSALQRSLTPENLSGTVSPAMATNDRGQNAQSPRHTRAAGPRKGLGP